MSKADAILRNTHQRNDDRFCNGRRTDLFPAKSKEMKYNEFGILECNVFCENPTLATLGVSSETWLPFSFDLSEVQAIKPASEAALDQQGVEACTHVFFKGVHECMAIDVPYEELRRLWIAHKTKR